MVKFGVRLGKIWKKSEIAKSGFGGNCSEDDIENLEKWYCRRLLFLIGSVSLLSQGILPPWIFLQTFCSLHTPHLVSSPSLFGCHLPSLWSSVLGVLPLLCLQRRRRDKIEKLKRFLMSLKMSWMTQGQKANGRFGPEATITVLFGKGEWRISGGWHINGVTCQWGDISLEGTYINGNGWWHPWRALKGFVCFNTTSRLFSKAAKQMKQDAAGREKQHTSAWTRLSINVTAQPITASFYFDYWFSIKLDLSIILIFTKFWASNLLVCVSKLPSFAYLCSSKKKIVTPLSQTILYNCHKGVSSGILGIIFTFLGPKGLQKQGN